MTRPVDAPADPRDLVAAPESVISALDRARSLFEDSRRKSEAVVAAKDKLRDASENQVLDEVAALRSGTNVTSDRTAQAEAAVAGAERDWERAILAHGQSEDAAWEAIGEAADEWRIALREVIARRRREVVGAILAAQVSLERLGSAQATNAWISAPERALRPSAFIPKATAVKAPSGRSPRVDRLLAALADQIDAEQDISDAK